MPEENRPLDALRESFRQHNAERITREEMKSIVKVALHEWLDEKYAAVGRWSAHGFIAIVTAAGAYIIAWKSGFFVGK